MQGRNNHRGSFTLILMYYLLDSFVSSRPIFCTNYCFPWYKVSNTRHWTFECLYSKKM